MNHDAKIRAEIISEGESLRAKIIELTVERDRLIIKNDRLSRELTASLSLAEEMRKALERAHEYITVHAHGSWARTVLSEISSALTQSKEKSDNA